MDQRPHLLRWREIVHPLFWPVFFWNLRRFVVVLGRLRAEQGDHGQIAYEITWWGAIRIHWTYAEAQPEWDDCLEGCVKRIHLATLDVFNSYLTPCAADPSAGWGPSLNGVKLRRWLRSALSMDLCHVSSPRAGYLPSQVSAGLLVGAFPELG
ncbi:MAG: hypothetical protein AAFY10_10885, partial [Pseudomonadota bacterium]